LSFAVWLTGLSGSGKSAIARALLERLHARGLDAALLESDVMRTQITPFPSYDDADRDFFYDVLMQLGSVIVDKARPVIFDATANRRAYRDAARKKIARFAEVLVDTPLEVCIARNTKGLYSTGATATLPGVQAPYEAPLAAELVVRGDRGTPGGAADSIVDLLGRLQWLTK
jgi:adenylylsulfate kinase